jgi:hypothetical protein
MKPSLTHSNHGPIDVGNIHSAGSALRLGDFHGVLFHYASGHFVQTICCLHIAVIDVAY